jgi:hypothetical protein
VLRLTVLWGCAGSVTVCDSVRNHLVPLLLGLAVKQSNDRDGHVVTSNTTGLAVRSQAVVHHVFTDGRQLLLCGNSTADELDNGLRRLAVPDTYRARVRIGVPCNISCWSLTVTSKHNKLVIVRQVVNSDIGVGSNDLLLRREVGALLELKVTDGTRQGEVAVDTTKVDEATSGANSSLLTYVNVSEVGIWSFGI